MKKFLMSALIIYTVSEQASAKNLIFTAYMCSSHNTGALAPIVRKGLAESSYDYSAKCGLKPENKTVCYMERPDKVCAEILATAQRSQQKYLNGESHEVMYLRSCRHDYFAVQAHYTLSSDFGEAISVERTLHPCAAAY